MSEQLNPSLVDGTAALSRRLAEGGAEPPGGAIAALVAAWAAALAGAAADRSREGWDGAAGARAQAQVLSTRALRLLERGARAHAEAMETLAARRRRADAQREREEVRDFRLGQAVRQAAEPPLELSACALDVAQLAQLIASHAAGEVRADAAVAAQLAAAAARAGAHLVEINLVVGGDRQPAVRARELAEAATTAAAQASVLE
jgi:formiminotetrahydrofolate cyclodeaminase